MNNLPEVIFSKVEYFLNYDELSSFMTACGRTCNRDHELLLSFYNTNTFGYDSNYSTVSVESVIIHSDIDENEDCTLKNMPLERFIFTLNVLNAATETYMDQLVHHAMPVQCSKRLCKSLVAFSAMMFRNLSGHSLSVNDDIFHNAFNNFVLSVFVAANDMADAIVEDSKLNTKKMLR